MRGIEMNVKGSIYEGREVGSVGSNPTFSAERFQKKPKPRKTLDFMGFWFF